MLRTPRYSYGRRVIQLDKSHSRADQFLFLTEQFLIVLAEAVKPTWPLNEEQIHS
jgi:hypothetical protein